MKIPLAILVALLLGVTGCSGPSRYEIPTVGHFMRILRGDRTPMMVVVDSATVEAEAEILRRSTPLDRAYAPLTQPDYIFVEISDSNVIKEWALYRGGEVLSDSVWSRVDPQWHHVWRIMYDSEHSAEFMKKTEPNQAPEPTPTAVTPPAGQEARQP